VLELLKDIGAYVGLAAFLGLAVLALLYFAQARDVRRLRESASFLVERPEAASARPPAAAAARGEDAGAEGAAAARKAADAEAFRRAELARQAAQRRARFEERRRGYRQGRLGWLPEPRSLAVIVLGVVLLVAGIAFGANRLLDEDEEAGSGGRGGVSPSQIQVAVFNGTAQPGLAAGTAQGLQQGGYDVTPVTNSEQPFDASIVMFDRGHRASAQRIASELRPPISSVEPINAEIREDAEGAGVAVVLGEDRVTGT